MADSPGRRLADAEGLGQAYQGKSLSDWRTNLAPLLRPYFADCYAGLVRDRRRRRLTAPRLRCLEIPVGRGLFRHRPPGDGHRLGHADGAIHGWALCPGGKNKRCSKGSAGKRQPTGGVGWRG